MRVLGSDVHGLALPCKDLERKEICKDDLEGIAREARRKPRAQCQGSQGKRVALEEEMSHQLH